MATQTAAQKAKAAYQSTPKYQAEQAAMKAKQFGAIGSQEAATNRSHYEATGGNPTQGTNVPYSSSNRDGYMPNLFSPGQSARDTASFNGSNVNDMSGMYIGNDSGGYDQATHGQAIAKNPLHAVNAQRQKAIEDAMASNQWQGLNNFEAGQAPGWYDKGADGNFTQNKQYWGDTVERHYKTMNEAGISAEERASREANLKDSIQRLNAAPGMMGSLTSFANDSVLRQQYGIPETDKDFWNSDYNNSQVRQDGRYEQNMWYDNQVFQDDPNLLSQAMSLSGGFGDEVSQQNRQAINNQYYEAPQQQVMSQQSSQQYQMDQQQAEFEAKLAAMEKLLEEQKRENAYKEGEATDANKGSSGNAVVAPPSNGEHIFDPGTGQPGYTQSNNSMNDALYKYLEQQWQGGF